MKILVIMKRFGTNKDMVMENFGRQIKIFSQLAGKNKIDFICPDYKKHEKKDVRKNNMNFYIRPYSLLDHFKFTEDIKKMIKKNKYELMIGSTEPLLGIIGHQYAKKFGIRYIYDLQDDYSSYDSYKIPFVRHLDKKTVKDSDIVMTVSESLKKKITRYRKKSTITIQNGIDLKEFKKISKAKARKILRLPKGKIIVYIGEISRLKGGDILIDAFEELKKDIPDANLLLSGKILDDIDVKRKGVIYKQYSKRSEIIMALNASDVGTIPNRENTFSKYCFPNKLPEYMAANLPIVASDLGDTSAILSKSGYLCKPNDKYDLAEKLIYALKGGKMKNYKNLLKALTWKSLAEKLEKAITQNG
jgi:teichuronic acid biosynthesis glycosyltransferase TuaC